jgi:hypothetical protein
MNYFVRQLFFLQPNIIVVMDRVVSTNPEFKKTWLLHSINEPLIDARTNSFELSEGDGRLVCIPVLPKKIQVSKIGGPGDEFLVDSTHFTCGLKSFIDPQELHYGELPGAWRIEERPTVAGKEDYFLNVILVSGNDSKEVPEVEVLTDNATEIIVGIKTADGKSSVVKFTKGEKPAAYLKIRNGQKVIVEENMPDKVELEKGRTN